MRNLSVAVAQITCFNGKIDENLAHASQMAKDAAVGAADLILFPEFTAQGYLLTESIWDAAEPFDGPTTRWLCESAKKMNIYIGSSFLEACNGQFVNTFVMADPSGKVVGVVRKRYPSMWEAYFFKGVKGDHVFDTDFGRVGVGICFDNHTFDVASVIAAGRPDIVLMPHSYCTPTETTKMIARADIDRLNDLPIRVARLYNSFLGVPIAMCNKSGPWNSPVPNKILGTPKNFTFSGRSTIIAADSTTVVELNDKEGVGCGVVTLNPELKKRAPIPRHGRHLYPGSFGREILRLIEIQGSLWYTFNGTRRKKARMTGKKEPAKIEH